jgi:hypothetical protein
MSISIWHRQIVDRIIMNIGIGSSSELYGVLIGQLMEMKGLQSHLVPNGKITISKQKYVTRLGYYPTKNRKIADLTVGSSKSKHMYFSLGLYPSKFAPSEFAVLKEHLDLMFQIPYKLLFDEGNVAYLELAADSLTHATHTFIPFRAHTHKSQIPKESEEKSTVYLGSKTSKKRFCSYNKAKQLFETGCPGTHKLRTRFEVRLRHIGMTASQIATDLPNPFSPIEIADIAKARCLSTDIAWQAFLDDCEVAGSAHTLAQCPKHTRKKYMTRLRACSAPWWNPDFLWKGIHSALEVVAP